MIVKIQIFKIFNSLKIRQIVFFLVCIKSLVPVFCLLYIFFMAYSYLFMPVEYLENHYLLGVLLIGMSTVYLFGPFSTLLVMTGNLYANLLRAFIFAFNNFLLIFLFGRFTVFEPVAFWVCSSTYSACAACSEGDMELSLHSSGSGSGPWLLLGLGSVLVLGLGSALGTSFCYCLHS